MVKCKICKVKYPELPKFLGICRECIRNRWEEAKPFVEKAFSIRKELGLPNFPPKDKKGKKCLDCGHECEIAEGEKGYCGLVINEGGKLKRITGNREEGLSLIIMIHIQLIA